MGYSILFVDDEQNVLSAYKRNLRKYFDVHTALSGADAIELLKGKVKFSVIVSDMQMPNMNGVEFLKVAKEMSKNSIRIMLTGNADQQTAIDAINQGDIFRFINKPCTPEQMMNILKVALKQYLLITAEQELLKTTLKKSIEVLIETLTLACPSSFGSINRVKQHVVNCARAMGSENTWMFESMAMLSLIGYVSLPDNLLNKISSGGILSEDQEAEYLKHSEVGYNIISKIPRLEDIAQVIKFQNKHYDGSGFPSDALSGKNIPMGARILKIALDYERFNNITNSNDEALIQLQKRVERYDPKILELFIKSIAVCRTESITSVSLLGLEEGMIIAEDVLTLEGILLVCKGQEITESLINRFSSFERQKQLPSTFFIFPEVV
ncbi:MAG: response regulator RpfG family c-di-GMP phosphodiesterase [Oleiphilaceae bacterium]|jgi:response regulator RpfG family c-di-GMP phosphodiesterase